MSAKAADILVPNDTSWFDNDPENYLNRDDFKEFGRVAGFDLRDLVSKDHRKVESAQEKLVRQSVIFNEIQKLHFGFGFPLFVYTHDFELFEKVPNHCLEVDKITLGFDMCDSLRRRHVALSHAILPQVVEELYEEKGRALVVKNLGSGVGLDSLHLLRHTAGKVSAILNYDTDPRALALGKNVTEYLERRKSIEPGVMRFIPKSLTKSSESADVIVKVGVICGLKDAAAQMLLNSDYEALNKGGKLVITSSNQEMRKTDPLASFLIQHIGSRDNPRNGWSLNFRQSDALESLLKNAGFSDIRIYDDANYPGKQNLEEEILHGIDNLPAKALGHSHSGKPLILPPREILDRNVGFNWIAIGTK